MMHFPEGDSKNYLTFYKRAAVFLAMGKSKSALPDLTKAIQLKPDFLAVGHSLAFLNVFYHIPFLLPSSESSSSYLFICLYFSGPLAEREHSVEAGQHAGGTGGL